MAERKSQSDLNIDQTKREAKGEKGHHVEYSFPPFLLLYLPLSDMSQQRWSGMRVNEGESWSAPLIDEDFRWPLGVITAVNAVLRLPFSPFLPSDHHDYSDDREIRDVHLSPLHPPLRPVTPWWWSPSSSCSSWSSSPSSFSPAHAIRLIQLREPLNENNIIFCRRHLTI